MCVHPQYAANVNWVDRLNTDYLLQIAANGLHSGMMYAVLAYGYTLAFIVTKRVNLAHGAVFALSGQVLVMGTQLGYDGLILTLPAALTLGVTISAFISSIALLALSAGVMSRFVSSNPNMMITATLGVAIVLMEAVRIGADGQDMWLPPLLSDTVHLFGPTITVMQLVNIIIMTLAIVMGQIVLERTSAGRYLRAVADDPLAASLGGVNVNTVIQQAIFWGGGFAAVSGILAVLYFGNMSFGAGLVFGLKVLFITSAGGFSKPIHAACGAFLYGEAESFWDGYFPIAWREAIFYAFLALILCLRQSGRIRV
jgi:branched-chain amino acid transport system permease protein